MLRSLIHVAVVLMLILQGVAQASAFVVGDTPPQHCTAHDEADHDCPCCAGASFAMNSGCSALCSVAVTAPVLAIRLAHATSAKPLAVATTERANPSYLPLTPPPIS